MPKLGFQCQLIFGVPNIMAKHPKYLHAVNICRSSKCELWNFFGEGPLRRHVTCHLLVIGFLIYVMLYHYEFSFYIPH